MKPTLQQLRQYTNYLMHEEVCATLKTQLEKLKQQAIDDPDKFEDYDDVVALAELDINSFVSFEGSGSYESNDEGGSYFSMDSVIVKYPNETLRFGYSESEELIEAMYDYGDLLAEGTIKNNPAKPFEMEVETV